MVYLRTVGLYPPQTVYHPSCILRLSTVHAVHYMSTLCREICIVELNKPNGAIETIDLIDGPIKYPVPCFQHYSSTAKKNCLSLRVNSSSITSCYIWCSVNGFSCLPNNNFPPGRGLKNSCCFFSFFLLFFCPTSIRTGQRDPPYARGGGQDGGAQPVQGGIHEVHSEGKTG